MISRYKIVIAVCLVAHAASGQTVIPLDSVSTRTIKSVAGKYESVRGNLFNNSDKALKRLQKQEARLQKLMNAKDSGMAKQVFAESAEQYGKLTAKLKDPTTVIRSSLKNYIPNIDSMRTTFRFFDKTSLPGIPAGKLEQVKNASASITRLQQQLQSATDIKEFVKQRQQQLQAAFDKLAMTKELAAFKKQAYYYQAHLKEYKETLNDPDKMMQKALSVARNVPSFRDFMSKNSILSQLFPMSANPDPTALLNGLQTRAGIQQQLTAQVGSGGGGVNPQQYVQQQVQAAQSQLSQLKDKLNKTGGGSSDMAMPDFKPNSQKTKSFLKRIEYNLNIQSQKGTSFLPVTSDIGLTAGYKLNDKSVIGIGAGYKMGWGKSITNIHLSNEGFSLRSFVDIRMKGSFWISGGYEKNYLQSFTSFEQFKNASGWQTSGLAGLTKKYKLGKKSGNMQLLWDFLSYSQLPQAQPLKFRVGYVL